MYGAVLDSEGSRVEVGECAIVCENAVFRATAAGEAEVPVTVGDHAFVGALVYVNSVVPVEFFLPPNTIAAGDPLEVYAPGDEGLPEAVRRALRADRLRGADGLGGPCRQVPGGRRGQSAEFGAHFGDVVLEDGGTER